MPFNPDEYLAKKESAPPFNPDAYILNKSERNKGDEIQSVYPENVQDELGAGTRAALSFASGDEEKRAYLQKKFPGILLGQVNRGAKEAQDVVKLPGESLYRYIDKPGFTMTDIADFAGDIPAVGTGILSGIMAAPSGPGAIPAAMAGAGAGELARKAIGRELIGIPRKQTAGEDAADVAVVTGTGGLAQYGLNKLPALKEGAKKLFGLIPKGNIAKEATEAMVETGAKQVLPEETLFPQKVFEKALSPQSSKELTEKYGGQAAAKAGLKEYPTSQRLSEVVKNLPDLQYKPLPIHEQMLGDKTSYDILKLRKELPDEIGQALNNYEQLMKQEAQEKLFDVPRAVAGRDPLPKVEAGESLLQTVKGSYEAKKEALGPIFQQFDRTRLPKVEIIPILKDKLVVDLPRLKPYLDLDMETGNLVIRPFTPKMGITETAHSKLNTALQALNSPSLSFREMQNIREYLRQSIDPVNPKSTQILQDTRKSLLDFMDKLMTTYKPKADVKGAFRAYAQNEQYLEQFERIIGGKVDNLDQLLLANPERVLDRVFSSVNNAEVSKKLLGDQSFNQVASDYLASMLEKATDKGVLSSNKFMTQYRKKQDVLKRVLPKEVTSRVESLGDLMRIIPDAASPNTSGTAKASQILGSLAKGNPRKAGGDLLDLIKQGVQGKKASFELDAVLSNTPPKKGLLGRMKDAAEPVTNALTSPAGKQGTKGLLIKEASDSINKGFLERGKGKSRDKAQK